MRRDASLTPVPGNQERQIALHSDTGRHSLPDQAIAVPFAVFVNIRVIRDSEDPNKPT